MRSSLVAVIFLVSLFGASQVSAAGGAIQLSAIRLTVEPRQRTTAVTLTNQSAQEQRYRVSVVSMAMDLDAHVSEVDPGGAVHGWNASEWVIATPAAIRLAPGESQKIRILVQRPGTLADGEYHAHLKIAQEPPADIAGGLRDQAASDNGLQFTIATVYTTTLPIFVRHGQVHSAASIVDARLLEGGKQMALSLKREGNGAFRGFVQAVGEDAKPVYLPCAIYPEVDRVNVVYEVGALAHGTNPLTVALYSGAIPSQGETPKTEALGSIRITPAPAINSQEPSPKQR